MGQKDSAAVSYIGFDFFIVWISNMNRRKDNTQQQQNVLMKWKSSKTFKLEWPSLETVCSFVLFLLLLLLLFSLFCNYIYTQVTQCYLLFKTTAINLSKLLWIPVGVCVCVCSRRAFACRLYRCTFRMRIKEKDYQQLNRSSIPWIPWYFFIILDAFCCCCCWCLYTSVVDFVDVVDAAVIVLLVFFVHSQNHVWYQFFLMLNLKP